MFAPSNTRPQDHERGAYNALQQSLVAPEEDLPTTQATVSIIYCIIWSK